MATSAPPLSGPQVYGWPGFRNLGSSPYIKVARLEGPLGGVRRGLAWKILAGSKDQLWKRPSHLLSFLFGDVRVQYVPSWKDQTTSF